MATYSDPLWPVIPIQSGHPWGMIEAALDNPI
jgi:hypothetical protein